MDTFERQNARMFSALRAAPLPENLLKDVLAHVDQAARKQARFRAVCFGLGSLASSFFAVPAVMYTAYEMGQTGFLQFLSLVWSDGGVLLLSWKEFSLTLLESFPVVGMTLALLAIFVALSALRLTVYYARHMSGVLDHPRFTRFVI